MTRGFREGKESVKDGKLSGRLQTSHTNENFEKISATVQLGRGECGQYPCPSEKNRECRKELMQRKLYVDVRGDSRVQWPDETRQLLYVWAT
ncbi:hypothetical protein TNCV_988451 [Trichonephila clavipes]|nr:hypothetical protein TNCV_988451 [Trichonephila clavipes]